MRNLYKSAVPCAFALLAAHAPAQLNPSFLNWSAQIVPTGNERIAMLRNLKNGQFLFDNVEGSQPNLRFVKETNIVNIRFVTQDFGSSELRLDRAVLGQQMAIKVGKEYMFAERKEGRFLLLTSKVPKFEWFAIGVGEIGTEPRSSLAIGLFNSRARDFLVYQNQPGSLVPLGWDKDDKNGVYLRGRTFVQNLRKKNLNAMADLVKRLTGW